MAIPGKVRGPLDPGPAARYRASVACADRAVVGKVFHVLRLTARELELRPASSGQRHQR
jgi:hypothetical protein